MSLVSGVEEPVLFGWGPAHALPALVGTASHGGQTELTNTRHELAIHSLTDSKLVKLAKFDLPSGCHAFSWVETDQTSLGKIVMGFDEGQMLICSPQSVLENADPVLAECSRHSGTVGALDWNPFQPNLLASGAQASEIFIWDMNSCEKPMTPGTKIQPLSPVRAVAWNAKIQHILGSLIGLPSGTQAVVWDLRKNEPIIKIQDRASRLTASSMAWNPSNPTQFAVGSEDDERPVVQLWDVRQAQQPYQTIAGHDKGISCLQWSKVDDRLLLAGGKDGRALIFNVTDGEMISEMPRQPGFCISAGFSRRHPELVAVASMEGGTQIYNMMGEPSAPKLQSQKQVAALDDAFGALDSNISPVVAEEPEKPAACKLPPSWFGKRVGATFGFGGKMVQWSKDDKSVGIHQIVTEPAAVQESKKLLSALDADIGEYCGEKLKNVESEVDENIWKYIRAGCAADKREQFIKLLGIQPKPAEPVVESKAEEEIPEPEPETFDIVDAEVEETTNQNKGPEEDDPFANISQSNAEPAPEPPPALANIEKAEKFIDSACHSPVFCIPSGPATDIDIVVTNALLLADFAHAVNVCLEGGRVADALVIAKIGGNELLEQTIQAYHRKNTTKISRLVETVYKRNWTDIVCGCELDNWKEALSALITYCTDSELTTLIDQLGGRLENDHQFYQQAALCFIISGNIDRLVTTIRRFINPGNSADDLQQLVEKILILRKASNCELGAISSGVLEEYAMLLSSQGEFESSLAFCTGKNAQLVDLRNRIQQNHAVKPAAPVQQATSGHGTAGQVNGFPAVSPVSHSGTGKNAFSRSKASRSKMVAPVSQPTQGAFTPQPVAPSSQPGPAMGYNPASGFNPQPHFASSQPVSSFSPPSQSGMPGTIPSIPAAQPVRAQPVQPVNPMPMSAPAIQPGFQPAVSQPVSAFNPTPQPMSQSFPQQSFPSPAYSGGGGNMYSADISNIPRGPALDRKEATPGWNDPTGKKEYAKNVDSSMRIKKNKKSSGTGAGTFNPTEMGMFTPAAQPAGHFGMPPGMGAPIGQPMGQPGMGHMGNAPMGQMGGNVPMGQMPGQMGMGQSAMMQPHPVMPVAPMGMQPMGTIPPTSNQAAGAGEPAEPLGPNSGAAPVAKAPLPAQYEPMKASFDSLLGRCRQAPQVNAMVRKKLDDAQKRLNSLYDKLRKNSCSSIVVDGLTQISEAADKHDYSRGLGLVQWIVQKANFSEVSSFLPGIKNLLQIGAQLKV